MTLGKNVVITLFNKDVSLVVLAKVDTGAYSSSISTKIAKKLKLDGPDSSKTVKSASGKQDRDFHKLVMEIGDKEIQTNVNIADRDLLSYEMILGQKDIKKLGCLVDVGKAQVKSKSIIKKFKKFKKVKI